MCCLLQNIRGWLSKFEVEAWQESLSTLQTEQKQFNVSVKYQRKKVNINVFRTVTCEEMCENLAYEKNSLYTTLVNVFLCICSNHNTSEKSRS